MKSGCDILQFQFHKGSIKTETGEGTMIDFVISIP